MTVALVLLGGGLGAGARYWLDRWIQASHRLRFPLGTMTVNLAGCLLLGVVAGGVAHAGWSPDVQSLLGIGLCGGLTTFSTFSVELATQLREGLGTRAGLYLVLSVAGGIALAELGWVCT
ncbi:MAG TPA: fluoride efflux transporter CrcB [Jatrophihabitantaceae bacterium]|jgi:CrcB protein|nr:fluoride efflux transporter CrcB [Jatrophihabitantaceae bacterium]